MGNRNFAENISTPPSSNSDIRYYDPVCTSAALSTASALIHVSKVFSQFLVLAAILCWNWVLPYLNSNTLQENCDDGSIVAGDGDSINSVKWL